MNLQQYRESIPMQIAEFARLTELDQKTIRNAEAGRRISAAAARRIARVLSKELRRDISYEQIDDLHVRL